MAKKPGLLEPLRIRIRRLQLIVGMGLLACVLGALLTIPLSFRVLPALEEGTFLFAVARALISQLWVYAVLPVLWYGMARILELRPWRAAVGSTVTGMLFQLCIALITAGLDGFLGAPPVHLVLWVLTAVAGAFLSGQAIQKARAASRRTEDEARKLALARAEEYAEFAREAERAASRTVAPTVASAVAPTDPPGSKSA